MEEYNVGAESGSSDSLVLVHETRMQHIEDTTESLVGDNGMEKALTLIVNGAIATADYHSAARLRDLCERYL